MNALDRFHALNEEMNGVKKLVASDFPYSRWHGSFQFKDREGKMLYDSGPINLDTSDFKESDFQLIIPGYKADQDMHYTPNMVRILCWFYKIDLLILTGYLTSGAVNFENKIIKSAFKTQNEVDIFDAEQSQKRKIANIVSLSSKKAS